MAQSEKQPYSLPRNITESARLEAQHRIYVQNFGYVLHPTIAASLHSKAQIADVATGTGAWMVELAHLLQECTFTGLDMSSAQFPEAAPVNCTFDLLNILEPVPREMQNRFDLVHIRLLVAGLTGDDWDATARNAMQLLRPGGWLQWCESEFDDMQCLQTKSGASRAALQEMFDFVIGTGQKHGKFCRDVQRLGQTLQKEGFEHCAEDLISSDRMAGLRHEASSIEHGALVGIARTMALHRKDDHDKSIEDVEDLLSRCEQELADGSYWRWNIKVVTARKPLS